VISRDSSVLLLTNHRGGGIGDFGITLRTLLQGRVRWLQVEETSISGEGAFRQSTKAAVYRGPVIANIGLTAWGRSGLRNFAGFSALELHRLTGFPTKVIVHHAIEIFNPSETGYDISTLVRKGAHQALMRVRKCQLIVFSPRLLDILTHDYGARNVLLTPIPGQRTRRLATPPDHVRPKIVHVGYWAPYKGIDDFIAVARRLQGRAEFVLVGQAHLGLSASEAFRRQVEGWKAQAAMFAVRLPGFLSAAELDNELSGPAVGLMPYTSVSGASASFQLFAERGVPVVASDLPEFQYLKQCGAGILVVPATLEGFITGIERLLDERGLWIELAERQEEFNKKYSWDNFVQNLLAANNVPAVDRRL
jgi:glycosyltransferase involved in cell wall biosynthesis